MGRILKIIVAGLIVLPMVTFGVPAWATVDVPVGPIGISVTIAGSTSMTVSYLETATGATVTGTLIFNTSSVTTSTPWAVADQCLLVTYSSNYAWGLRIVTNNIELTASTDPITDPISNYIGGNRIGAGSDGTWGTADDVMAYSGLVAASDLDLVASDEDPTARASLAWQAYDEWADYDSSYAPTSSVVADRSGYIIDDTNVGDAWVAFDDWHYIGDKSDDGFSEEIYSGSTTNLTYPIVACGSAGSNGSLVPATGGNPDGTMVALADNDIVIFIASRFASTNYEDPTTPVPYVLEPDTYTTSLYLELIHE